MKTVNLISRKQWHPIDCFFIRIYYKHLACGIIPTSFIDPKRWLFFHCWPCSQSFFGFFFLLWPSCFCGVGLLHVVPPSHFYLPKIDDAPKHINSVQSVASIAAEFMADIGHTFDDDDLKQPYYNMFSLMGTGFFGSVGCIINFGMY